MLFGHEVGPYRGGTRAAAHRARRGYGV
jgi:hypothetical protein